MGSAASGVDCDAPAWIHYDAQQEAPERSACLQGEAGEVEHPWNRVTEPGQNLHPGVNLVSHPLVLTSRERVPLCNAGDPHHTEGDCAVDEGKDEQHSDDCAIEALDPGAVPCALLVPGLCRCVIWR